MRSGIRIDGRVAREAGDEEHFPRGGCPRDSRRKTGFAYSDELTKRDLELAADTARYIAHSPGGTEPVPVPVRSRPTRDLYPVSHSQLEVATAERVALLNRIDEEARRYDPRIKNVMASFNTEYKIVMVATSEGTLIGDVQPLS